MFTSVYKARIFIVVEMLKSKKKMNYLSLIQLLQKINMKSTLLPFILNGTKTIRDPACSPTLTPLWLEGLNQGSLTEGEGSLQLTSLYLLV